MVREVFLQDVPDITPRGLRNELEPIMNRLQITDWMAEKSRNKRLAWVRFLEAADGVRFLQKYGAVGGQNKLTLANIKVRAVKSRTEPDTFVIRALSHARDERIAKQNRRDAGYKDKAAAPTVVLRHVSLSIGHNMFINNTLTFIEEWKIDKLSMGSTRFGRRMIVIKHRDPTQLHTVRIEIPYDAIISSTHSESSFLMVLQMPPRFLEVNESEHRSNRLTGLPNVLAECCLVYRLGFASGDQNMVQTWQRISAMEKFETTMLNVPVQDPMMEPLRGRIETHLLRFRQKIAKISEIGTLPFSILFQAEALVTNNFLHPRTASELLRLIVEHFESEARRSPIPPISADAMKRLMLNGAIDYAWRGADPRALEPSVLFDKILEIERAMRHEKMMRDDYQRDQMQDKAWIMRATVSPTRITLHGPEPEALNRILRKYSKNLEHFLRVSFAEEDGEDLRFAPKVDYSLLRDRFEKILKNGIPIGGRIFGFLGFSHSSLRARSVWLQAAFVDDNGTLQTYATIIRALGEFDKIRVPAKCAARIGQAFTETSIAVSLMQCGIVLTRIKEVITEDGKRMFSDGVGVISKPAVRELWRRIPNARKTGATCFQIRLGGVKGMLALDSRFDDDKQIMIRQDSMMKFMCNEWDELGICEIANKPLKMYLNRQLIKILEDMNVPRNWFIRQQRKELDMLKQVTSQTWRSKAFLERQAIGTNFWFPRFLEDLDSMGIDWRQDPFLKLVVSNAVMAEVRQLKHKSRIPISKGVTLFGVMDETGYLNEGEIFVTFDTEYDGTRDYIDDKVHSKKRRRVLVTRSPALHPGDVQLVWMVRPPEGHSLRSLQNCIVFARRGLRDLPSQLSGGDLDGDKYHVIWDPEALNADPPVRSFGPADYPTITAPDLGREVEKGDMIKHFLDFMQTDQLGIIATRHMIIADQRNGGTQDPDCIKLAELHSTAVDFSKSGVPVDIQVLNSIKHNRLRPDFLAPAPPTKLVNEWEFDFTLEEDSDDEGDGPKMNYYASNKILGELYRNVDERRIWHEDVNAPLRESNSKAKKSVWDQFLGHVSNQLTTYTSDEAAWEHRIRTAWQLRSVFDTEVSSLRLQYSQSMHHPLPEVDVFCGQIFNRTGLQTRRQRDAASKVRDDSTRNTDWLVRQIQSGGELPSTTVVSSAGYSLGSMSVNGGVSLDGSDDEEEGDRHGGHNNTMGGHSRQALELAFACVIISRIQDQAKFPDTYKADGLGQSFRIVAACCLVREIMAMREAQRSQEGEADDALSRALAGMNFGGGGGYLGVNGRR